MNYDEINHKEPVTPGKLERLKSDLNELDHDFVEIDGVLLRPSQCYHFEADPEHLLFNTNCPDDLKQKVQAIMARYLKDDESGT